MIDHARETVAPLAVLITGANGYLATQIIMDLLTGSPGARVACLIRSQNMHLASRKLFAALDAAAAHSGQAPLDTNARARISVVLGDLDDLSWVARIGSLLGPGYEVVHCAASLSFLESDRAQVLDTNVGGTQRLMAALAEAQQRAPMSTEAERYGMAMADAGHPAAVKAGAGQCSPAAAESGQDSPMVTQASQRGPVPAEAGEAGPVDAEVARYGGATAEPGRHGPAVLEAAVLKAGQLGPVLAETGRPGPAVAAPGRNGPSMATFNYVSTAYVAGRRTGCIREDIADPKPPFNNAYEESKSLSEVAVTAFCAAHAIPFRIFRPSIIIGHSRTGRSSSTSGFYKVLDRLATFAEMSADVDADADVDVDANPVARTGVKTARAAPGIGVTLPREATLDLIPVDIVASEMILVMEASEASTGRIFHITSEHTTTLFDFAHVIGPILGVTILPMQGESGGVSFEFRVLDRLLSNYASYFSSEKHFDRSNVRALGADLLQKSYRLDLSRLTRFVTAYLDERSAAAKIQLPRTGPSRRPRRVVRNAAISAPSTTPQTIGA